MITLAPCPSNNIGINQIALFQCWSNHTGAAITWFIDNGTRADNNSDIVVNGSGSSNSSLTIPGYPQYNNTVVRCNAFAFVNGSEYFNFSESTLRLQGLFNYFSLSLPS